MGLSSVQLTEMELDGNNLHGTLPSDWSSLTQVYRVCMLFDVPP